MIGQLLAGRYLILEALGTGGFSETYLARDKYRPQYPVCVVKCLRLPATSSLSPSTAQQLFEFEAQMLDHLGQRHSQIPTLFAYCPESEPVYLVQEYIDGEPLDRWIRQGRRITPKAAIALLADVLSILETLHADGIIHHDIKPSNLIRRHADGQIVLIDFGAARQIQSDAEPPRAAVAVGTPGYMPDEQDGGISQPSSDLYALGMLVIHLLTGTDPRQFERDPISGELNWRQDGRDRDLPPALVSLLDRMVRIEWRDRYQQASEVLADLRTLDPNNHREITQQQPTQKWLNSVHSPRLRRKASAIVATSLLVGGIGMTYLGANIGQGIIPIEWLSKSYASNLPFRKLHDRSVSSEIRHMAIAPNNRILVTSHGDRTLRSWTIQEGKPQFIFSGATSSITTFTCDRQSRYLFNGTQDGLVQLWNLQSGELLWSGRSSNAPITAAAISPDAKTATSANQSGELQVWNLQSGERLRTLSAGKAAISSIAYTDSQQMVSASDRHIHVWNSQTNQPIRTFSGHKHPIQLLQYLEDGYLVSFDVNHAFVWHLKQEALVGVFPTRESAPSTAHYHQQTLVTATPKGTLQTWNYHNSTDREPFTHQQVAQFRDSRAMAISPNLKYVACWGRDRHLQIWKR